MRMAFLLTTLAGLSTVIGSFVTCFVKRNNLVFLSGALGFAAGVMIYVSFLDILPEAFSQMHAYYGPNKDWYVLCCFVLGMLLVFGMELLLPEGNDNDLKRTGKLTALVIALHNFPEGMATFTASVASPILGIKVACAIALHNIPEGVAVAVPLFYGEGRRKKAILMAFLSGLSEPLGAVGAYTLLRPMLNGRLLGILLAFVAGIMVQISVCELMPRSRQYGHKIASDMGVIAGMAVMVLGSRLC